MKKRRFQYSLKEMTRRLFAYAKPIRGYLTVSTLASIIGNLGHMGLMGFGAMWILCAGGYATGSKTLYILLTVLSALSIAVGRYLEGVVSHIGAYGMLAKLRIHLFACLDRVAPAFMVDRKQGDILNIAVSDVETLEFFFAHMIGPMFTVFILPAVTLCIAWHYHILYVLVLLPVYVLISILIPLAALKAGRRIGMRNRENLGELKSLILESIYGIKDIQIFGHGAGRLAKVMQQNEKVNRSAHGLTLHRVIVSALPSFFVYLGRILILLVATYLTGRSLGDPVGTIVISFVATASFSSTFSLTSVVSNLLETYAAAERFFIIEDTVPQVQEAPDPKPIGKITEVALDHVSFAYPGTQHQILDDASLTIHAGEWIGLHGESGIGKSTVLRLLLRFYEPSAGSIRLNGQDIRQGSLQQLHQKIAMLEQETYLFDTSIAENIALARPGATRDEIKDAAQKAGIADFIETLPEGYDTPMGQMGARLSGGERQRIGIARIMLADPDVIVMDEPTSSLDVLHEKELLHTLHHACAGKTILIISHRMSTLADCDRLCTLKDGKILEDERQIA